MPSWIFVVLTHWNITHQVDMSFHSESLSWSQTNQSFVLLLKAACFAEKRQISLWLVCIWFGSNPWSTELEASTLTLHCRWGIVFEIPHYRLFKSCSIKKYEVDKHFFLKLLSANKDLDAINLSNILHHKLNQSNLKFLLVWKISLYL